MTEKKTDTRDPLFDEINDATGFANGARFTTAAQVRAYFTAEVQRQMFGDQANTRSVTLALWANDVIENGWHMDEAKPSS